MQHSLIEAEAETIRSSVVTAVARVKLFMESMNETIHKLGKMMLFLNKLSVILTFSFYSRASISAY